VPRRPSARIRSAPADFQVRQTTWWQLQPDRPLLVAEIAYAVSRGRLFQLPLQLPAGWSVERVDMSPPECLRNWTVTSEGGRSILQVDLQQPLAPAMMPLPVLKVWLQAPPLKIAASGLNLPFPDLVPLGPRLREGALGISLSPLVQATVTASTVATAPEIEPGRREVWGDELPDYYFAYRGPAVEGTVALRPRPARVRAHCRSEVILASGRALLITRLELEPEGGAPQAVNLFTSAPVLGDWRWTTVSGNNQVKLLERRESANVSPHLAALAAHTLLQAAVLAAARPPAGEWYRLTLARPLRERLELECQLELPGQSQVLQPGDLAPLAAASGLQAVPLLAAARRSAELAPDERFFLVPLLSVPAAERMEGEVTISLAGNDLIQVESDGLRELGFGESSQRLDSGRPGRRGAAPWRSFRYGHPPMALVLRGRPPALDRSVEAVVDQAELNVSAEPGGRLMHFFRFQTWNWRQRDLPVQLPDNAHVLAVRSDGRWLGQLPESLLDGRRVVSLPVPAGGGRHRFELIYAVPSAGWLLWTRLEAPPPQLPVRPLTFRRSWSLPPGVTPLWSDGAQPLPVSRGLDALSCARRDQWTTFHFLPSGWPALSESDDWLAGQRQRLAEAVVAIRQQHRPAETLTLGAFLERLLLDHWKDRTPLVLDTQALGQGGLGPETVLPAEAWERSHEPGSKRPGALPVAAPWESLGLVYVPCRAAPLLTSRRELQEWRGGISPVSASMEQAVAEAVLHGHDASGRFRTVLDWLPNEGERGKVPAGVEAGQLVPDSRGDDWTDWQPQAGADADSLLVVRQEAVPILGMVLAAALLVAAPRLRRSLYRWRFVLLLVWLALSGLALLWLPPALRSLAWWPMLAGLALSAVRCLRYGLREWKRGGVSSAGAGAAVSAGIALAAAASLPGQALAPGVETVWIVPAARPDDEQVLATPELLEQLDALAERGAAGLRGALLLRASYDGQAGNGSARFDLHFHVYCFSDDPTAIALPLAGVNLEEALLDGARAFPRTLTQPREGFSLPVEGRGWHVVVLRCSMPVSGSGEDRLLAFTVPELVQSQLSFTAPAGSAFLASAGSRGQQQVEANSEGTRLQADLGRLLPDAKGNVTLQVRWREGGKPQPPVVRLQEAYLWDVRPSHARLVGVLQYIISQGTVTSLALELPKDMEVRSPPEVEAGAGPSAIRLRDWQLVDAGNQRRLQLFFQGPVSGNVHVTLDLVPRQPFGPNAVLTFPNALGVQPMRGMLAYRVEGLEANFVEGRAVTGIDRQSVGETFLQYLARPWRTARQEELGTPTGAFWSTPGSVPMLRLNLQSPPSQVRAQQNLFWQVNPRQVDLRASARLTDPEGALVLVEWDVPTNVTVGQVTGPDLLTWSRTGPRLQVWLQRPVKETTLQLLGWIPRKTSETQFDLPCLRLTSARQHRSVVRVWAGEGLAVTPERFQNLQSLAEGAGAGAEFVYASDQLNYKGNFRVTPARENAEVRLLTFVEVRDRRLTFVATLDYHLHRGELRHLTIGLRKWDGEVRLDAPQLAQQRELNRSTGRSWVLELKPGVTGRYQLTLSGSVPLQSAPTLLVPDVRLETTGHGPAQVERWLAVAGSELSHEAVSGLQPVADAEPMLHAWFARESNRLRRAGGTVWKVESDDWRLRLRPRPGQAEPPIHVFLAEQSAAVVDGRRWGHQIVYSLYHEAGADLRVVLPQGAEPVRAVAVDGVEIVPLQPDPDRLWVPLPGSAGARTVRLNWSYDPASEPLDRPNLEPPQLEGVATSPALWTVHVPAGFRARVALDTSASARGEAQSATAAGQELRRAAAQLHLLSWLAERARSPADADVASQLAAARQRFERLARVAEYRLGQPEAEGPDLGPDGQSLSKWLTQLRSEYAQLVKARQLDKVRAAAATASAEVAVPRLAGLPQQGMPSYWQAPAGAAAPRLRLIEAQAGQARQTWILSGLLLVLLAALWGLALLPRGAAWPEQLALLGALGLLTFGPGWALLFLLLPGVWLVVRAIELAQWLWSVLPRPLPAAVPIEPEPPANEPPPPA
jgi:hypothetical protein